MKQAIIILIMTTAFIFSCGTGKAPQNPNNSGDNPAQNNNSAIAPPAYDPDNPVGGNINSKEPIAYADREFLRGIVDYDSIATIEPPQGWPELLDNSFHIDYNSGEMQMVRPEMVFGVAEALGIETQYQADYLDIENCDFRLYALYVQKVKSEVYFKALYNYEDKVPEYLAVYKKLENDSVANRKDLAIQRCYRLTDKGSLLMLDYYFNNYIFERPEDPMTGPLKSVDNITDYIKQVYGNVAVKDNRYIIISDVCENKRKDTPGEWLFGTEIMDLHSLKNVSFNNPYLTLLGNNNLKKIAEIGEKPAVFPSGVLLDKSNYFRYTYDKIIDGNPSTSYVEKTTNNLFHIFFYFTDFRKINAFSIINGYSQNNDLYFNNNRIKKIKLKFQSDLYNDDTIEVLEFTLSEDINPQILAFKEKKAIKVEIEIFSIYAGKNGMILA